MNPIRHPLTADAPKGGAAASAGADRERGSLTLFAMVLILGLLAMTGLVVDGGAKLTAQRRADHEAEQAARAGAQALDPVALRGGQPATLNPRASRAAALAYLQAAGYPDATVTVNAGSIEVHLSLSQPTVVLGLLGIRTLRVDGAGRARLLTGVHSEQTR